MQLSKQEEIRSALTFIDSTPRETWIRIGMAIKAALGDQGFCVFDEWSARAENYTPKGASQAWLSFRSEGGITKATIFGEAARAGWVKDIPRSTPLPPTHRPPPIGRPKIPPETVALTARSMLSRAKYRNHPYLAAKGFPGATMPVLVDTLLVPMWPYSQLPTLHQRKWLNAATQRTVSTIQMISREGVKTFLTGSAVSGCVFPFGPGEKTMWVEGLATGFSVLDALNFLAPLEWSVHVCFNCHNLARVARGQAGFVCADNDTHKAGQSSAEATGLPWWCPPATGDANDLHQKSGLRALVVELDTFLKGSQYG